jgi:hypothetical protein
MANTDVTLINQQGTYVPSAASIPVVSGDTISFSTNDGSQAFAFFSPDAIANLSPAPANPFLLAAGRKSLFSFLSSRPGAYSAYFSADPASPPVRFQRGVSQSLLLEVIPSNQSPFTGPGNAMTTGH